MLEIFLLRMGEHKTMIEKNLQSLNEVIVGSSSPTTAKLLTRLKQSDFEIKKNRLEKCGAFSDDEGAILRFGN